MIGDPSGKSNERNLLDEPTLTQSGSYKKQLSRF
jgi:tyrosyl-tRNA synthetase